MQFTEESPKRAFYQSVRTNPNIFNDQLAATRKTQWEEAYPELMEYKITQMPVHADSVDNLLYVPTVHLWTHILPTIYSFRSKMFIWGASGLWMIAPNKTSILLLLLLLLFR